MKEVQTSEHAISQLPMGTMFEGFDLNIEDFMITVYWGGCNELKKADIDFPRIEDMAQYGSNYQTIYRVEFPFGKPKYE